jgi:hypothetical protein
MELSFLHLHGPLFFGNKNWGEKLQQKSAKGTLKMIYEKDWNWVRINHETYESVIPISNVVSMTLITPRTQDCPQKTDTVAPVEVVRRGRPPLALGAHGSVATSHSSALTSQASTPHDHVFANGAGKTRD